MRITMKAATCYVGIFSAALLLTQSASAFIIDSFDKAQALTQTGNGFVYSQSSSPDAPSILGGYRDVYLSMTRGTGYVKAETSLVGTMEYTEAGSASGGGMVMTWDGNDLPSINNITTAGLGSGSGIDFTAGGQNRIDVAVVSTRSTTDEASTLSLTVWDIYGHGALVQKLTAGTYVLQFQYSAFVAANSLINMTKIGAVQLGWMTGTDTVGHLASSPGYGGTANFDYVETGHDDVPEPGTMALMAALMGLGGLGVVIRRRATGAK